MIPNASINYTPKNWIDREKFSVGRLCFIDLIRDVLHKNKSQY